MKKLLSVFLVCALLMIGSGALASPVDLAAMSDDDLIALRSAIDTELQIRNPAADPEAGLAEGDLGAYHLAILGAEMGKDFDGKDCLIVTFSWSHTDSKAQSFLWAFSYKAFQNGVEIDKGILLQGIDAGELTREVKAGVTREVQVGFILEDITSPVEIEVSELISFSDDKVEYTFTLPL